jgi:hypothetical protein
LEEIYSPTEEEMEFVDAKTSDGEAIMDQVLDELMTNIR